jgi:xanthine dehydrogenase accessory factor
VSAHEPLYPALAEALRAGRRVALATIVDGAPKGRKVLVDQSCTIASTVEDPGLAAVIARDTTAELSAGHTCIRHYGLHGEAGLAEVTVFVETFASRPRMLIFGTTDFAVALARVAKVLGYRVTVCDPRPVFATEARFPEADELVLDWPHRLLEQVGAELGPDDAVCVLTHDARFDVPAIRTALGMGVGYIGALGSRRTHARRRELLVEAGVGEAEIERVMAPIGLDLGARSPEETAVAICAEIIATRSGRTASSLARTDGPIH